MAIVTDKPCEPCDGTGLIEGQTCSACEGTGEVPVDLEPHDQIEWNVKYVVEKVDELETKIDTIARQVQALYDDLNP